MSSITDGLNHLIDKMVETDRRMARRAGQHIDNTNRILEDARQGSQSRSSSAKALPSAMPIPFAPAKRKMTKTWLAELVKPYKQADPKKFQGITAAKAINREICILANGKRHCGNAVLGGMPELSITDGASFLLATTRFPSNHSKGIIQTHQALVTRLVTP